MSQRQTPNRCTESHLGHARTYVCLDILRRVLEHTAASTLRGGASLNRPLFVMNITDVDDKILAAAAKVGEPPLALARRYEAEFWRDLDALHCLRPHVVTRVTEHVESHIVPFIERLVTTDMAYQAQDGVYFDVKSFEDRTQKMTRYGKLAPSANSESLFSRILDPETTKKDPRDFVLWKAHKEGERMYWESPWGLGRPGWHVECSAMIEAVQERFQATHRFALHAGGVDLKFPHHTNEIAQSEAYHVDNLVEDKEWMEHWVHFGHVHIDGLKMSKSLKNFITVQEMLKSDDAQISSLSSPADDFRLWCLGLSGPYRGPATYSSDRLAEARGIRGRIVGFLMDAEEWMHRAKSGESKLWTNREMELFQRAEKLSSCQLSTMLSDLDGSSLLKEVMAFVDVGGSYLSDPKSAKAPVEAMAAFVQTLRGVLSLVGFSSVTVDAGVDTKLGPDHGMRSRIAGGEGVLLDTFVEFRDRIRRVALDQVQRGTASEGVQEILHQCDTVRDESFPSIGVELVDDKLDGSESDVLSWKYCLPRVASSSIKTVTATPRLEDLRQISVQDFFRSSLFEGEFSAFDEKGIPTHNADGTELSKRQLNKLQKKRSTHEKRLGDPS